VKGKKPKPASAELRKYVEAMVNRYRAQVRDTPGLLSVLYDVDLLPEQLGHVLDVNPPAAGPNASRFGLICELWRLAYPDGRAPEGDPAFNLDTAHTHLHQIASFRPIGVGWPTDHAAALRMLDHLEGLAVDGLRASGCTDDGLDELDRRKRGAEPVEGVAITPTADGEVRDGEAAERPNPKASQ
jgi:hypothetical protein